MTPAKNRELKNYGSIQSIIETVLWHFRVDLLRKETQFQLASWNGQNRFEDEKPYLKFLSQTANLNAEQFDGVRLANPDIWEKLEERISEIGGVVDGVSRLVDYEIKAETKTIVITREYLNSSRTDRRTISNVNNEFDEIMMKNGDVFGLAVQFAVGFIAMQNSPLGEILQQTIEDLQGGD